MIIEKTNLNLLADDLIKELLNRTNPFDTITIVVPNLLIEQWLKSYWLRNSNRVLMNVSFKRLKPFLFEVFNTEKKELFNNEILSILIMKELIEKKEEYPQFSEYVSINNEINSINLYDLSKKLASIFMDYEKDEFIPLGDEKKLLDSIKASNLEYVFLSDIINNDIKLNGKVFVFGFRKIDNLYLKALDKLNCIIYKQIESPKNNEMPIVYSCASMEREIEFIHGEICNLLNDKKERLYNIVVYCPNLTEYEPIIKKVFFSSDNKKYPEVPYAIINNVSKNSNAALAIRLLYDILCSKQFTRYNLLKLITNSNVAKARNIDKSLVNIIIKALDDMNVYRNHQILNEWQYAIKRLLLAKLVGDSYSIDNAILIDSDDNCNEYLPYGSISMTDEAIIVLVKIIDDIDSFINNFKDKKMYNSSDLERLKAELDKWLNYSDTETNFYYNAAINSLNNFIDKNVEVPFEIVFLTMIEAAQNINIYPTNIINGGVTFINLKEDNIISSKHMFFIGMSNNNIPRKNILNELDYRTNVETLAEIDKEVFNLLQNNSINTYISFVNQNLQTLEEYFPSSLYTVNINNLKKIGLLETRDYSELYTKREIEKKNYNIGLYKSDDGSLKNEENVIVDYPKYKYPSIVKYKLMSNYLNENLISKMELLFKEYDDELNNANVEYEPLEIDSLNKSNIKKSIFEKMYEIQSSELDKDDIDAIKNEYRLSNSIPYIDVDFEKLVGEAKKYYDKLPSGFEVKNSFSVDMNTKIDSNDLTYNLQINSNYLFSEIESADGIILRFDFARVKEIKTASDVLDLYIIALAYLASMHNDLEYIIHLGSKYIFKCSKSQAIKILNNLYKDMYDFNDAKIIPFDVFNQIKNSKIEIENIDYSSFENNFKNLLNHQDAKNLIRFRDNAGYTIRGFNAELNRIVEYIKNNVLYIFAKEEDE